MVFLQYNSFLTQALSLAFIKLYCLDSVLTFLIFPFLEVGQDARTVTPCLNNNIGLWRRPGGTSLQIHIQLNQVF